MGEEGGNSGAERILRKNADHKTSWEIVNLEGTASALEGIRQRGVCVRGLTNFLKRSCEEARPRIAEGKRLRLKVSHRRGNLSSQVFFSAVGCIRKRAAERRLVTCQLQAGEQGACSGQRNSASRYSPVGMSLRWRASNVWPLVSG